MSFDKEKKVVINELSEALDGIDNNQAEIFVEELKTAEKVFFIGVGRVRLSLAAMAKRFAHLGINCSMVGDITEPAITSKDLLVVGSGSGESIYPLEIARKAKSIGSKIFYIGSNLDSSVSKLSDYQVYIPTPNKLSGNLKKSAQPMTTLFEQSLLLFGDIATLMIIDKYDIDMKKLWQYHANLE